MERTIKEGKPSREPQAVLAASARQRVLILGAITVGYFLVLLDLTVVNVALPTVGRELGASVSDQQWVIDGYTVTLASLLLTGGKLGDLWGKKRLMLIGMVAFGLSSLACGLAATPALLVGFRVVQGLAAALLLPTSLAIVSHLYQGDRAAQARAIGIWAAVGSLAMPAGPLLGGLLVEFVSWRAVFLINLPVIAVSVFVVMRLVEETTGATRPTIDIPGTALGAVVLSAVTVICVEGGRVGWGNPVIVLVTAAIPVLLGCFLYAEHVSDAPVLPLSMFRSTGTSIANGITVVMSLVLLGTIFMMTQYFQVVENRSPLTAGIEMIPLFVPLVICSALSGRLTARKGAAFTSASGLLVGVVGMLLLTRVGQDSGYVVTLLLPLVCIGSGMGLLTPAVVATAMREAPREHTGIASGVNNTARQAGGAIGAAVFGSLVGSPVMTHSFLHGLRIAALTGAVLWAVGFALAVALRRLSAK